MLHIYLYCMLLNMCVRVVMQAYSFYAMKWLRWRHNESNVPRRLSMIKSLFASVSGIRFFFAFLLHKEYTIYTVLVYTYSRYMYIYMIKNINSNSH